MGGWGGEKQKVEEVIHTIGAGDGWAVGWGKPILNTPSKHGSRDQDTTRWHRAGNKDPCDPDPAENPGLDILTNRYGQVSTETQAEIKFT